MTARRRLAVGGGLLGIALLVAGVVVAVLGVAAAEGPAAVVRGYFAALAAGDAPQALAYGDLPPGSRSMLTAVVLAEQLRVAPLRDVTVGSTTRHGDHALVSVHYELAFGGDQPVGVNDQVPVHRSSGQWRLDRAAVATRVVATTAGDRLSVLGGALPTGRMLLFPGALPVRPDTPYLEVAPTLDHVSFTTAGQVDLPVEVSARGESAVRAAVRTALRRCLAGAGDPSCPLPNRRYVPGSVHGTLAGPLGGFVDVDQQDPAGLLHYAGTPAVSGSWRRLDFSDVARPGTGRVRLDVRANCYAVDPLRLRWST